MELAKKVRECTLQQAKDSYEELKTTEIKLDLSRAGLKALDYYFLGHRLKTKTKRHLSFYEAMKDKAEVKHLNELVVRYRKKSIQDYDETGLLKAQYAVFQLYYGTINQFRPTIARWVYSLYEPKCILDFSAGWGGRCMAAMSMGIPYIGIDANPNLKTAYERMIAYEPNADVTMVFKPSETVDFSKWKYDFILPVRLIL